MSAPTLPQGDADAAGRAEGLHAAREAYTYDYTYQGLCFTGELPKSEGFDAPYITQSLEAAAAFKANRAGVDAKQVVRRAGAALEDPPTLAELTREWREARSAERVTSLHEFDAMLAHLRRPLAQDRWNDDRAFAWQRVAGAVPTLLTRLDAIPAHFPVTQRHLEAALGAGASLEGALAEKRLFLCDYARFDRIPCGVYPPDGRDPAQKYLAAPLALFCATADRGLLPVAIQCAQRPSREAPVYTPADGARWRLARAHVQVADANLEGIVVHFGYTHMLIQRFIMAARRQLSERHPLLALLSPHFRYTLAANDYARKSLVVVNGTQDRVLAPRLEATLAVLRESLRELTWDDLDPARSFARAGVDDTDVLEHPFRDDSLTVYAAIRRWAGGYVSLYYASDADAAADAELRAMLDEIGSPDGGRLPALVRDARTATRGDVADLCARVIYRASTYHAAINYNWYDWMAYAPNMPAAAMRPMPSPDEPVDEGTLLAALPPRGLAWEQLAQVHSVDALHVNFLGEVPAGHFTDPRVAPLLDAFRRELADAEGVIAARNRARTIPYTCLLPSRTTASINS